ncbi:MAG TPA: hypothetical protein VFP54_12360 [Acidimicrobiales bacterium]|nr:hypothetical protein [Acidimicrobiales bacterium]
MVRALDLIGGGEIVPEADCWDMLAPQSAGRLAVHLDGTEGIPDHDHPDDGHGTPGGTDGAPDVTVPPGRRPPAMGVFRP